MFRHSCGQWLTRAPFHQRNFALLAGDACRNLPCAVRLVGGSQAVRFFPVRAVRNNLSARGCHGSGHAREREDMGNSERGRRAAMWVLSGAAAGCLLYAFGGRENRTREEPAFSTVLTQPPEKFVHPLNSEPFPVRLWIAAKRILFLVRCFTPFAAVTFVYLLQRTSEARAMWVNSLVHALESAGCTFQKFGQWMSMRPDMLPPDIILALSRLRDDVPQHSMEHNRTIFRVKFGLELDDVFELFEEAPIASGTVAQVHRATLRGALTRDGMPREVAVKIRHPHVVEETFVDIDLIFSFINCLGEVAGHLTIPFKKDEFHGVLQRQVDFRWEAHNLYRFATNFRAEEAVIFPEVLDRFYSDAVLVESWVSGRKITDVFTELKEGFAVNEAVVGPARDFDAGDWQRKRGLAKHLFDATMKMFLRDNYIHGDLHGGNVLYGEVTGQATVIDAGVVTSIEAEFTSPFAAFLLALCRGDAGELADRLIQFNTAPSFDAQAFRADIEATTRRWVGDPGRAPDGGIINLGDLVGEMLFKIQKHRLHLRGDVASTIVTMSLVEGLVKQLDPDFDIVGTALPYFRRYHPDAAKMCDTR